MSVVASRLLIDRLCGEYQIPLRALHDFDKAGFSILAVLNAARPVTNSKTMSRSSISVCDWQTCGSISSNRKQFASMAVAGNFVRTCVAMARLQKRSSFWSRGSVLS